MFWLQISINTILWLNLRIFIKHIIDSIYHIDKNRTHDLSIIRLIAFCYILIFSSLKGKLS